MEASAERLAQAGKNKDVTTAPEILEVTQDLSDRLFDETRMATYLASRCNAEGLPQTATALDFAKEKHQNQFRKPGHSNERIPYINHPLLLTCHALALGFIEDDLLAACLLHDVCEDCGVAPEELPVSAPAKDAVALLTKPEGFSKTAAEYRSYYDGIAKNRIATIVKLLDRCCNISEMATSFSDEHMAGYIKETLEYFGPLMATARREYPEYADQLFLIRYHMRSVLGALRHHMRSGL